VDEFLRLRDPNQRRKDEMPWHADGLVLQIPRKFAEPDTRLPSWLFVAAGGQYREALGFLAKE